MTTPTDEITIDLDAADKKAVSEAAKKANGAAATDSDTVVPEIADDKAAAPAKKAETPIVSPDEGLEKLKKDLENERAARQAAEQRANEAAAAEVKARTESHTSQLDLVKGAIERLTESQDTLESQLADAMTAQDYKAVAKLQRQMGDNSAKLIQLEAGKKALESAPKPTPRVAEDPVERLCSQLTPASARWVRAHPEFASGKKYQQMIAAHELAMARGHEAESDGYFASIEKTLDIAPSVTKTDPAAADPSADAAQATGGRSTAPAAAPVSRATRGANGQRANTVTLTPEEVEIAGIMNMSLEDYARNKLALRKEGKLS